MAADKLERGKTKEVFKEKEKLKTNVGALTETKNKNIDTDNEETLVLATK